MQTKSRVARVLVVAGLLALVGQACSGGPTQELGTTTFTDLKVRNGITVVAGGQTITAGGQTITAGGQTITAGGQTVTAGDVAVVGGQLDVGKWVNLSAQTAISVTAASTITPVGTYQQLTSGSAVTTSTSTAIANGTETGDVLVLINNNASDTITIDGTGGNVECKTDKVLGAKDTLTLIWGGSDWYCLAISDNS